METPALLFVCCLVAAVLTARALRSQSKRPKRWTSAWGLVIRTPALLVPATLTVAFIFLIRLFWFDRVVPDMWNIWSFYALWYVVQSATLAGFVGLLHPAHRGAKPNGMHFWLGIRRHFWTFLIAIITSAILVMAISLSRVGLESSFWSILFVGPSLIFAPLFGVSALHPGRPLRAIFATLERVRWDLTATAWLLTQQLLIFVLLWVLVRPTSREWHVSWAFLANYASALSFNAEPYLAMSGFGPLGTIGTFGIAALAMLTSTVYMIKYYRRVMDAPVRGERVASRD